ncbi:hypothetical protein [Desulfonatronum sp. SC1]|uniref:hypothetical protein n=1 Tax=Desulfonatronum sp. SC1 TaxID=2109626 RepID=UPI000D30E2DD|nr:hypothetical protein [Desulfonatronum sp. SC1]PTN33200.1 hypothetical protein C6366_15135 [Desulfonatronum sp. SC1]
MIKVTISTIGTLLIVNRNAIVLTAIYSLALAMILDGLFQDISSGGNAWKQGDWLINNHDVVVRRGLFGSVLLLISSVFDFPVLVLLGVIQGTIISLIFALFWYAGVRNKNSDILTFLLLSPIFLIFSANDLQGSLRKEILAYLSFLPLLFSLLQHGIVHLKYVFISLFLWTIAVSTHEANVFFSPFIVALTYIGFRSQGLKFHIALSSLAYIVISGVAFFYSMSFSSVESHTAVCAPLLKSGLNQDICSGAIRWLEYDVWYGMYRSRSVFISWGLYYFVLTLVFMCTFIFYLFQSFYPFRVLCLFLLVNLFFLPLYFIAIDWGRWINFGMFSFVVLFIAIYIQDGRLHKIPRMNTFSWISTLLFCIAWGVHHGGRAMFEFGFAKNSLAFFSVFGG